MAVTSQAANAALRMEREAEITNMLKDTCWVWSCCGCGLHTPCPVVWSYQKCLCVRIVSTSGEECCGHQGCCSEMSKLCCVINHTQVPPNPCKCGLCNFFCLGGHPRRPAVMTAAEAEQASFFQNSFWCHYCCCNGCGVTRCGNPLVKGSQKCFCVKTICETADVCGTEGCSFSVQKGCCMVGHNQCPPAMSPGIGCCNILCMGNLSDSAREVLVAPEQTEMRVVSQ